VADVVARRHEDRHASNADDPFQDIWVMDADGANRPGSRPTGGTGSGVFDSFPDRQPV
jgi:hypothetical protein